MEQLEWSRPDMAGMGEADQGMCGDQLTESHLGRVRVECGGEGAEEAVRGGERASESGGREVEVESAGGWGKRISRGRKGSGGREALTDEHE